MLRSRIFQKQVPLAINHYKNFKSNSFHNEKYDSSRIRNSGYLSKSQWFEKSKMMINDQSHGVCNQLREQPLSILCHDIKYNTWDKFSEIEDIDSKLSEVLKANGHDVMTQIQKHTFDILNRQLLDILGSAETGSGKTVAYLAPLLNNLMKHYPEEMMKELKENNEDVQYPLILVLAPTRELVNQISSVAKSLLQLSNLRCVSIIGGTNAYSQIQEARSGCHTLIATPGRLTDLAERGIFSLKYCNKLVIDEADRMLDMGFEPQIRRIVRNLNLPPVNERHTSMYSATFPKSVMSLAATLMKRNYGEVVVGKNCGTNEACVPDSIEQEFILTEDVYRSCFDFLQNNNKKKTLVFCNKKLDVDLFYQQSKRKNIDVAMLHGDLTQYQRDFQFDMFKSNKVNILLATSVAARGLDVSDIECVVNMGLPFNADEYVHRVGRCGRMGRPGKALSFVNRRDATPACVKDIIKMLKQIGKEVPDFLIEISNSGGTKLGGNMNRPLNNTNFWNERFGNRMRQPANERDGEDRFEDRMWRQERGGEDRFENRLRRPERGGEDRFENRMRRPERGGEDRFENRMRRPFSSYRFKG